MSSPDIISTAVGLMLVQFKLVSLNYDSSIT